MKLAAVAALALALTACSSAEPTTGAVTETVTETRTATETITETSTSEATATPTTSASSTKSADGDITDAFVEKYARRIWIGNVDEVTRSGDSIEVRTAVVDPRGADGSTQAQIVLEICRATLEGFSPRTVKVLESDGTTFAHAGIDGPKCVEY